MNVFLLISKEVVADIVESVGWEFMLTNHVSHKIKLNSTLDVDVFCLTISHYFWLKGAFLDSWYGWRSSEMTVASHLQFLCPFQDKRQVEVDYVVSDDEVRIVAQQKFLEICQQFLLIFGLFNFYSWYGWATMQNYHKTIFVRICILTSWQGFANTSNLNDLILFGTWEPVLGRTFYIKWHHS